MYRGRTINNESKPLKNKNKSKNNKSIFLCKSNNILPKQVKYY